MDKEARDAVIEECAQRLEREWPGPGAGPAASILRDMKSKDIILTEKGLQLVIKLDQYNDQIDATLKGVSEKEASQINQVLDKLRNASNEK